MIFLFFAIVSGIAVVSTILYAAGKDSIDSQVRSTMRFSSKRASALVANRLDADFFGLNVVSDSLSRGLPTTSNIEVIPSKDLFWIEARDIIHASAVFFAPNEFQHFYGAAERNTGDGISTYIYSQLSSVSNGMYQIVPVQFTKDEAKNLQTVPDNKKTRVSFDAGKMAKKTEEESLAFDARKRD